MAFVKINENLLIDERGKVLNKHRSQVKPKVEKQTKRLYVDHTGTKMYIDELVIQYHGTPPKQGRKPRRGERIKYKDGNKGNVKIENLSITDRDASGKKISVNMDDVIARLAQMVASGRSMDAMIAEAKGFGIKLTAEEIEDLVGSVPFEDSMPKIAKEVEPEPEPENESDSDTDKALKDMQDFLDEDDDESEAEQTTFASKKDNGRGWFNLVVDGVEMLPKNKREEVIDEAVERINNGDSIDEVIDNI